jgi:hypothetical protein
VLHISAVSSYILRVIKIIWTLLQQNFQLQLRVSPQPQGQSTKDLIFGITYASIILCFNMSSIEVVSRFGYSSQLMWLRRGRPDNFDNAQYLSDIWPGLVFLHRISLDVYS